MMIGLRGVKGWLAVIAAAAALGGQAAHAQSSVPEAQLETFLGLSTPSGLSTGALTNLGNGPVMNGSAIMETINVGSGGGTFSFDYNFLTNSPSPASNPLGALDPFAFNTQPVLTDFADNFSTLMPAPSQSGYLYETGTQSYSVSLMAGTYNFGIGVVDVTTDQYSSGLTVSNFMLTGGSVTTSWLTIGNVTPSGDPGFILLTSIPEPSSAILLVLGGLGAVVGFSRRKPRIEGEN